MNSEPHYFQSNYVFRDLRSARNFLKSERFHNIIDDNDFARIEIKMTPSRISFEIGSVTFK